VAVKKIPSVDLTTGATVAPAKENGIKLEMFVFDSFASASRCIAYAVPREPEFTAVKNAPAPGVLDSPYTARLDISNYHMSLMAQAVKVKAGSPANSGAGGVTFTPGLNGLAAIIASIERLAVLATNPSTAAAALASVTVAGGGTATPSEAKAPDATPLMAASAVSKVATDLTLFELSPLLTYDGEGLDTAFAPGRVFLTPCEVVAPDA
jgi:hypothetical protein